MGFYNTPNGNSHGYSYDINRNTYATVGVSGATSVTAAAINNNGDVAGFATESGHVVGFLKTARTIFTLKVPGASMTQAFGVNDGDVVAGAYMVGAKTYGFAWVPGLGFQTVNDPNGVGSTTVNGINDRERIVGFYTDSSGNTDGFFGTPKS